MPEPRARRATSAATPPKSDEPQRLAGKLNFLDPQPSTGAHSAIHSREASGRRPHQRDGAFGHCGVAIALDDVNGGAVPGELSGVHIAARAGAEENDVPEAAALGGDQRWQRGVIDYRDLGVADQGREFVGGHTRLRLVATGGSLSRRSFLVIAARASSASTNTARNAPSTSGYSGGTRSNHGCAVSSWAASASRVASSP